MAKRKPQASSRFRKALARKFEGEDPNQRSLIVGQSGRWNVFGHRAGFATIDTKTRHKPVIDK